MINTKNKKKSFIIVSIFAIFLLAKGNLFFKKKMDLIGSIRVAETFGHNNDSSENRPSLFKKESQRFQSFYLSPGILSLKKAFALNRLIMNSPHEHINDIEWLLRFESSTKNNPWKAMDHHEIFPGQYVDMGKGQMIELITQAYSQFNTTEQQKLKAVFLDLFKNDSNLMVARESLRALIKLYPEEQSTFHSLALQRQSQQFFAFADLLGATN